MQNNAVDIADDAEIDDAEHFANFAELQQLRSTLSEIVRTWDAIEALLSASAERNRPFARPRERDDADERPDARTMTRNRQLACDASNWRLKKARLPRQRKKGRTIMSISENESVRKLQQHIWRLESFVCSPAERETLRAELKALYSQKAQLLAERDRQIREDNAAAVDQMGGGCVSNDARTAEQLRLDIAAADQRKRQRFQEELNGFGSLLAPKTFRS